MLRISGYRADILSIAKPGWASSNSGRRELEGLHPSSPYIAVRIEKFSVSNCPILYRCGLIDNHGSIVAESKSQASKFPDAG
jgi:hypothetical protein